MVDIGNLRREYQQESLLESNVAQEPWTQFTQWWQQIVQVGVVDPNAMTLATVETSAAGYPRPSARIVLLKSFDKSGFVFFTHFSSRKGKALTENPCAALLFYWPELERQIHIEGKVARVQEEESEAYFTSRPLASRWGALASPQSTVIPDRAWLEEQFSKAQQQYPENPPRPNTWGGYRLQPDYFEFWQGRPSRLHDRFAYHLTKEPQKEPYWERMRLAP